MTEAIIIALIGLAGTIIGYLLSSYVDAKKLDKQAQTDSAQLLLEAEKQLQHTIDRLNRMWAWNRQLQDHIYKNAPPPPPPPPDDLFGE